MSPARAIALLVAAAVAPRTLADPPEPIRYDLGVDGAVAGAAALAWAGRELA